MSAVILIPSQGDDATSFGGAAHSVLKSVYNYDGSVFESNIQKNSDNTFNVTFSQPKWNRGKTPIDFWDAVRNCSTFVVMSHHGLIDGPILYHVKKRAISWQPWGQRRDDLGGPNGLRFPGTVFWSRVGRPGRTNNVKIAILGCNSGSYYAPRVAQTAQCDVYGFLDSCSAANGPDVVPRMQAIEAGRRPMGMVKREPA